MARRQNALGAATPFGRAAQDPRLPASATRRSVVTSAPQLTVSHSDGKSDSAKSGREIKEIPDQIRLPSAVKKQFSLGRPRCYLSD